MTPRHRKIVLESFEGVREIAGPLSQLFYGRLFELEPGLRPMFQGDIVRQGQKLMEMLTAVVDNIDALDSLQPVLRAMGERHVQYGVLPRHYDTVEHALIWALGHALPENFDDGHKEAWRAVIGHISQVMKDGAAASPSSRS
ncbi:MAG: hemin receptor [Acidobacteria bacterium]|nr:hemin receptor [Acidobacteriota bacterium]